MIISNTEHDYMMARLKQMDKEKAEGKDYKVPNIPHNVKVALKLVGYC